MNISFISSGSYLYKGISPAKERNIPFGIMGAELPHSESFRLVIIYSLRSLTDNRKDQLGEWIVINIGLEIPLPCISFLATL